MNLLMFQLGTQRSINGLIDPLINWRICTSGTPLHVGYHFAKYSIVLALPRRRLVLGPSCLDSIVCRLLRTWQSGKWQIAVAEV